MDGAEFSSAPSACPFAPSAIKLSLITKTLMKRKTVSTALALLFISLLIAAPRAQQPSAPVAAKQSQGDRIALYQALLDLTNPWTVMCIAAHPDDEDGTSLIVMRRKYGAHTVSVFSTFGEGGQNAIGPELYEELGAIRARETMAAAEIQGSEPYFLGLKDFGYSKSADEAFRVWGHDEALRRMVLKIRKLRPDVIITNHSVTNNDHGHHQATARLELEAFDAAADPKRFPEQLKEGVTVWQVQRLFVRARFGNAPQNSEQKPDREGGLVTIDPNERDPIRDTTFAEEALRALQKHATQGPWPKTVAELAARFRNSPDGKLPLVRYVLVREAKGADALTKDSHNFLDGLRLPEDIAKQLAPPNIDRHSLTEFVNQPDHILDVLLAARKSQVYEESKPDDANSSRMYLMKLRLNSALARASGISLAVRPLNELLIPNTTSSFFITISNRGERQASISGAAVDPRNIHIDAGNIKTPFPLAPNATVNLSVERQTPDDSQITVPHAAHLYDGRLFGEPILTFIRVDVDGTWFPLIAETHVDVAPSVEVTTITPHAVIASGQNLSRYFTLQITSHQNEEFRGRVLPRVVAPCESIACKEAAFEVGTLLGLHRSTSETFRLAPKQTTKLKFQIPLIPVNKSGLATATRLSPYQLVFRTERPSKNGSWETIGESIPVVVSYVGALVAPNLHVGYIRGFDYSLPNALAALGVESKELGVDDVKTADLQKYSAIIVDNRVYESQPELIAANQRLLDYAKNGGTLIVFYHKSFEWNPDERHKRPQLAPYKLILGDERITDENAPITFIEREHPVLNFPNKINQEDFAGWIQERGLYYPKDWDAQYHALLASNDPGEAPLKGGVLVADYGRGHYIYTSMVWYRQLRAGVPGAYRMLANMISYGHVK